MNDIDSYGYATSHMSHYVKAGDYFAELQASGWDSATAAIKGAVATHYNHAAPYAQYASTADSYARYLQRVRRREEREKGRANLPHDSDDSMQCDDGHDSDGAEMLLEEEREWSKLATDIDINLDGTTTTQH